MYCKYFQRVWLAFLFSQSGLSKKESLKFWWDPICQLFLLWLMLFVSQEISAYSRPQRFLPVFSPRSFMVLVFMISNNFLHMMQGLMVTIFPMNTLLPEPPADKTIPPPWIILVPLLEINEPKVCGSLSRLHPTGHWPVCQSSYQHHTLIAVAAHSLTTGVSNLHCSTHYLEDLGLAVASAPRKGIRFLADWERESLLPWGS